MSFFTKQLAYASERKEAKINCHLKFLYNMRQGISEDNATGGDTRQQEHGRGGLEGHCGVPTSRPSLCSMYILLNIKKMFNVTRLRSSIFCLESIPADMMSPARDVSAKPNRKVRQWRRSRKSFGP